MSGKRVQPGYAKSLIGKWETIATQSKEGGTVYKTDDSKPNFMIAKGGKAPSTAAKSATPTVRCSKKGWLEYFVKKDGKKMWERRFFWLFDEKDVLAYSSDPKVRARKYINLNLGIAEEVRPEKFHFKISYINGKPTQHFKASSEEEMLAWMDSISEPVWSSDEDDSDDGHFDKQGSRRQASYRVVRPEAAADGAKRESTRSAQSEKSAKSAQSQQSAQSKQSAQSQQSAQSAQSDKRGDDEDGEGSVGSGSGSGSGSDDYYGYDSYSEESSD